MVQEIQMTLLYQSIFDTRMQKCLPVTSKHINTHSKINGLTKVINLHK